MSDTPDTDTEVLGRLFGSVMFDRLPDGVPDDPDPDDEDND